MKEIILGIIAIMVVGGLAYGGWILKKNISYSFEYEAMVIETIEKKYESRIQNLEAEIKLIKQGK